MPNRDVALHLHISVNTVKTHLANIYGKLGVNNRTQAVARARELGVLNFLFGMRVLSIPVVLLIWMDAIHPDDRLVGGGMGVLALLEYLNYFHLQLSYDNRADVRHLLRQRRLKRGIIARTFGW
jgi:hypothetical protein